MASRRPSRSIDLRSTLIELEDALVEWQQKSKASPSGSPAKASRSKRPSRSLVDGPGTGVGGEPSSGKGARTSEASARARKIFRRLRKQIIELSK